MLVRHEQVGLIGDRALHHRTSSGRAAPHRRPVRVNGNPAKPSAKIRAGDGVHALIAERERIVKVVRRIETRVGAATAATCYVDNSPPVIREIAPGIKAVRSEGRPSKRLRRELERMGGRAGPDCVLRASPQRGAGSRAEGSLR
jgi:ribosome-associated heat shock protein Hsp15